MKKNRLIFLTDRCKLVSDPNMDISKAYLIFLGMTHKSLELNFRQCCTEKWTC